jgi:CBS domain-containing protein
MQVAHILKSKSRSLATIGPAASVLEAACLLRDRNVGAVLVTETDNRLIGILSERDITRAVADRAGELGTLRVEQLMTRAVITCALDDQILDLMRDMTENRIRHLPVVEDGALVGIVSIGDVVKHRMDELESETSRLREYIATG